MLTLDMRFALLAYCPPKTSGVVASAG
jgi:hypothetical protein